VAGRGAVTRPLFMIANNRSKELHIHSFAGLTSVIGKT